jgi:hypothetical protein
MDPAGMKLYPFVTLILGGGVDFTLRPPYPRGRASGTYSRGGSEERPAGLEVVDKIKVTTPPGLEAVSAASYYND